MIRDLSETIFSRRSSLVEKLCAIITAFFLLACAALFAFMIFDFFNSEGLKATKTAITVIELKQVVPAHSSTITIVAGKVIFPQTTHHPESYRIHYSIDGKKLDSSVSKVFFDNVKIGSKIEVDYATTRLDGSYDPSYFRLKER